MKPYKLLAIILTAFCCAGCTQNNGRIGRLFGSWVLETALINGKPIELPAGSNTYWSFQADIIRVTLEEEHYVAQSRYGTFRELPGEVLQLRFDYSDDGSPAGSGSNAAPEWMGFPASGTFNLQSSDVGGKLKLMYYRTPEETLVYYFAKTW